MSELLDVVDESGEPTGQTVERTCAHAYGIRHRTSHVWIYKIEEDRPKLLLQKRCSEKDSFPGCYDISSAGHIPAGDGYEVSAVRELWEELGVRVPMEALIPCGYQSIDWDAEFHGIPYHDRQVTKIFLLRLDGYREADFTPQESEVESVRFMDWEECLQAVAKNEIPHCISLSELAKLSAGDARLTVPEKYFSGF